MATKKTALRGKRLKRPPGPTEKQFLQDLGANIKQKRNKQGLTAARLAHEVKLTLTPEFERESGRVSMPVEDLARYAIALACQPADLVPDLKPAAFKPLTSKPPTLDATSSAAPGKKKKPKP